MTKAVYYSPSIGNYCHCCAGAPAKTNVYYKEYLEYSRIFCSAGCEEEFFAEKPNDLMRLFVATVKEQDGNTYCFNIWAITPECATKAIMWYTPWVTLITLNARL